MQAKYLDILCHLPWRSPRQIGRRVLILPDGNGRIATNLKGYAAGADNVVACAEYFAQRGDIDTLVVCIVSDLNAQKRSDAFFDALLAQFARLHTNVMTRGHLLRKDIRCRILGNLEYLRSRGGAREALVEEALAVARATDCVCHPQMLIEFWFAYADDIAWQTDVDVVIRTGAEEPDTVRPGMSLPLNVPCKVTSTLWPEAMPAHIGALVDDALRDHVPQFAPGYDLAFIQKLLRVFPTACIAAPVRITIPVCAPESEVLTALEEMQATFGEDAPLNTMYDGTSQVYEFGARDDLWYRLQLVPAARWTEFSSKTYDAIITPGQQNGCVRLAMPVGQAHVHSCVVTPDHVLAAVRRAIRFPIKHVMLHGADRSTAATLASSSPWPLQLLDTMHEIGPHAMSTAEDFVRARRPANVDADTENEWLIRTISAKVLGRALGDGLLLPDEPIRQSDRNYAYTGAYMMLRIADEGNPDGLSWEPAAEIAIRCMLAISTGDNGVFDRMYPGEETRQWHKRLETSAQYLTAIAQTKTRLPVPATRDARLLRAIGKQWQTMLAPRTETHPELVAACRDALRRHYLANMRERSAEVVDNPLVHWLCLGGLPRREAFREIEKRYVQTTPAPVGQRIRFLLETDVTNDACFQAVRLEMMLLLHLSDTAHSIAVEVLFLFCALTTPAEALTPQRLETLVRVGQVADYAFRLANDLASLRDDLGGDQDRTKESCLSILIPKLSSPSDRASQVRRTRELGTTILAWLEAHLGKTLGHLRTIWPSMATKVMRAIRVGKAVYAEAHYTTLSEDAMMTLLRKLETEGRPLKATPGQTSYHSTATTSPAEQKSLVFGNLARVAS